MNNCVYLLLGLAAWATSCDAQMPLIPSCEEQYQSAMESKYADKTLARFYYRICGKKVLHELEVFDVSDGVDAFEAWYLATTCRLQKYGSCGLCHVPVRNGEDWEVVFAHGAPPIRGPLIRVNATTGIVRCGGKLVLTEPMANISAQLESVVANLDKTPEERLAEMQEEAKKREAEIIEQLRQDAARTQSSP